MGFVKSAYTMSWSISFVGIPEKVEVALLEQSDKLSGASKEEYDAALPHLVALVRQNMGTPSPIVRLTASGYGWSKTELQPEYRQCSVQIEQLYGALV